MVLSSRKDCSKVQHRETLLDDLLDLVSVHCKELLGGVSNFHSGHDLSQLNAVGEPRDALDKRRIELALQLATQALLVHDFGNGVRHSQGRDNAVADGAVRHDVVVAAAAAVVCSSTVGGDPVGRRAARLDKLQKLCVHPPCPDAPAVLSAPIVHMRLGATSSSSSSSSFTSVVAGGGASVLLLLVLINRIAVAGPPEVRDPSPAPDVGAGKARAPRDPLKHVALVRKAGRPARAVELQGGEDALGVGRQEQRHDVAGDGAAPLLLLLLLLLPTLRRRCVVLALVVVVATALALAVASSSSASGNVRSVAGGGQGKVALSDAGKHALRGQLESELAQQEADDHARVAVGDAEQEHVEAGGRRVDEIDLGAAELEREDGPGPAPFGRAAGQVDAGVEPGIEGFLRGLFLLRRFRAGGGGGGAGRHDNVDVAVVGLGLQGGRQENFGVVLEQDGLQLVKDLLQLYSCDPPNGGVLQRLPSHRSS
ncbi:hypothetical protein DFJ73DRAFT_224930 [Zopfochytrium polystomum]|nr:hypothetical protein DFJ73DRAFT_224930 [Zopfochytrium polystomum]